MSVFIGADNFTSRGLPSGYSQLEYIQSSGTQCIDTGVSITAEDAAKIKFEIETQVTIGTNYNINGTGNGASPYYNSMYLGFNPSGAPVYGDGRTDQTFSASYSYGGEKVTMIYDAPNQKLSISGYFTDYAFTFQAPTDALNFLLFGYGRGTENKLHTAKIYSAKMWKSGTLIRDFVPCKNSSGTLGLYDLVNSKFYTNAGSGTFTAGTDYVSGNIAREVDAIDLGVSAIAREVDAGYLGVSGIAREVWGGGTPLSDLSVGDSVYMNVNGISTEFLVVHRGIPSTDYDSSCDGTWLLMKDCYVSRDYDTSNNDYKNSDIHSYLNNTFINLLDSDIRSAVKQVKLPYVNDAGGSGSLATGSNGISTKAFLLSAIEVGFTGNAFYVEGAALGYFSGIAASQRIAYLNGSAVGWWLRSPTASSAYTTSSVHNTGMYIGATCSQSLGIRPCVILPSTQLVDSSFNVIAA